MLLLRVDQVGWGGEGGGDGGEGGRVGWLELSVERTSSNPLFEFAVLKLGQFSPLHIACVHSAV